MAINLLNIEPHKVSTDLSGYVTYVYGQPKTGKAQPVDTMIPTPTGLKRLGDIKIGDYVFDRMGAPTKVLGVYPQGELDEYRVTLADGRVTYCGEEHLWTLVNDKEELETLTLREIMDDGLVEENKKWKYSIPTHKSSAYISHKEIVDKIHIIRIEPTGYKKEMVCILVDNKEHLYLTNDFIVTHNTTLSAQAQNALLLAFEEGYKAIPGVMAQPITTWSEMKQVLMQLKKPETKEMFKTIVVDTVDIAGELCEKYVCQQNSVEEIGKVPFGQGWGKVKREFESVFRTVVQMGYALIFISHSKATEKTNPWTGVTYIKNIPTCPDYLNQKIAAMADIYAFAEKYVNENMESKVRLILRSPDNSAETGSRFKYIPPVIEMGYEPLVKALNEAINKEAEMNGGKFITSERNVLKSEEKTYEQVIDEFNATVADIMKNVPEEQALKGITWEVEKILGKDKKVSDTTPGQKDLIIDIINNLKANMNYRA